MLDAVFPSQKKVGDEEENHASTDADKIYDKNGKEIYKGDDVSKCVSYNPAVQATEKRKYGWCVTTPGGSMYDRYRFDSNSPTFYFVFDRNEPSTPDHAPFDNEWHAFVIQVNADGESYIVTGADNRGDIEAKSWNDIANIVPSETWARIKGLKEYFKPIPLSGVERSRKIAGGKNLTADEFKELSQEEKTQYIIGKISKAVNEKRTTTGLEPILSLLPKYKIPYQGRSTTLANIAIDAGQHFPYSILKDYESLAKRYAIVRSRYTNEPIPLLYIKYLDDKAKLEYIKNFDDNISPNLVRKYFGGEVANEYINDVAKKLNYLPKEDTKYIKDPKLRSLYELLNKLNVSWKESEATKMNDEELANQIIMPEQEVDPKPLYLKGWQDLSDAERKVVIALIKKYNGKKEYRELIFSLPFLIKDGANEYILAPINENPDSQGQYDDWVLVNTNGKVVKKIPGDSLLSDMPISSGYPNVFRDFNRIYDIKDLTE